MAVITITGWGADIEYVALEKDDFVRLTRDGVDSDTLDDLIADGENESGAINGECELYIDGVAVKTINLSLAGVEVYPLTGVESTPDYVLIKVSAGKGEWKNAEIDSFDFDKLELSLSRVKLPNGEITDFVNAYYDSDDIDFGYSDTKNVDIFILDKEGKRYEVEWEDKDE